MFYQSWNCETIHNIVNRVATNVGFSLSFNIKYPIIKCWYLQDIQCRNLASILEITEYTMWELLAFKDRIYFNQYCLKN